MMDEIITIIIVILLIATIFGVIWFFQEDNTTYKWVIELPQDPIEVLWYTKHGWKVFKSPDETRLYLVYHERLDNEDYVPKIYELGK